jgi:hypothetical protein
MTDKIDPLGVRSSDRSVQWAKWHSERAAESKAEDARRRAVESAHAETVTAAEALRTQSALAERIDAIESEHVYLSDIVRQVIDGTAAAVAKVVADAEARDAELDKEILELRGVIKELKAAIEAKSKADAFRFAMERDATPEELPKFLNKGIN